MVRPAHSADLRSRLRHVSSAPSVAYSMGCSDDVLKTKWGMLLSILG